MKVLIFDSGKGGEYVAQQAMHYFPEIEFDSLADTEGMPYGNKSPEKIIQCATKALEPVINNYEVIVIACHTLTQVGIENLRRRFPTKKFVGFDPGIKKAFSLGFREVCVLATPATLKSDRYKTIKNSLDFKKVTEPDCSGWATAIEKDEFDPKIIIREIIGSSSPCIVLACTHYFIYEDVLNEYFDDIAVINPTKAVLNQLGKFLTAS